MKDKIQQTVDLEAEKIEFLEEMAKAYHLSNIGKAVRCLINYARENPDKQNDIFSDVRCLDC